MNVPSISGPRGLFDIFVPGVFLVLNVGLLLLRIVTMDPVHQATIQELSSSGTLIAAVVIAAGYLAGAILRLLKTQMADRCSTWVLIHRLPAKKRIKLAASLLEEQIKNPDRTKDIEIHGYLQRFPYANYLCTRVATNLGPRAIKFVRLHWSRECVPKLDRDFVNHWKTILALRHPTLHAALFAEEALVRFVASMFYALCVSIIILSISWAVAIREGTSPLTIEPVLLLLYFFAIAGILLNFRNLRVKEATAFFSACYAAQSAEDAAKSGSMPLNSNC